MSNKVEPGRVPNGVKHWAIALYCVLFVLGVAGSCFVGGPRTDLVIADSTASPDQLRELAGSVGRVRSVEPDGFLPVRARGSFESARRRLHELGVDYVFRASARDVDPKSLASVRQHIAYEEARKLLSHSPGGEKGVDFYEALEFYLQRRVESDGRLDQDRWRRGADHREQMPKWRPRGRESLGPNGAWEHLGPFGLDTPYRVFYGSPPLSGRKTALSYAPSNASVVYAVGGGSGVWRSSDGGATWTAKSDGWQFLQANSIAVDPLDPNIVYVGTGDFEEGAYSFGMMKSTDGGNTWTNLGASVFGTGVIQQLVIDPADRNTLVACVALGGAQNGIWRSTNGGVSWTQVLPSTFDMHDLDISAEDGGRTWWCVAGSGLVGGKIYNSTDGITWSEVASPSFATEIRMDIACSKVNRNTVYLLACGAEQIYKTTNGGTSWSSVKNNFPNGTNNYNWSQKFYDYNIGTTKNGSTDVLIVGLITVAASFNGGATWTDIGRTAFDDAKTHNDQHSFANHPQDEGKVLIGNDGGVWLCSLNAATQSAEFTPLNDQISDHMFYAIAVHPTDPTRIMGGAQDNATPSSRGNLSAWDNLWAGDGGWCAFDRNNPEVHYTTAQGLHIFRYETDDDPLQTDITGPWTSAAFIAPMIVAGNGSEVFAASSKNFWKWDGFGNSWTQSGQDLAGAGEVTYLSAAPTNGNVIYSGANNGQVWRTANKGTSFVRIDAGLPDVPIGTIGVSPSNPNDVLVGLGNAGLLYRCLDTSIVNPVWTLVSGSGGTALPQVPVNAAVYDPHNPGAFYVGTDLGAFMTADAGQTWSNMNAAGLPNVMISDLEVNAAKTHLYAGTYGRGIWRVPLEPATHAVNGWVRQNGTGVAGTTVRLMQGSTVIKTVTPDTAGNFTINAAPGAYTLSPIHNDKTFFPATRSVTVPPAPSGQNFTAGNIGPVSISWQYQSVVYADQSRQGTLGLNVVTPVTREITMVDNSLKLTSPIKVTVPAGQRTKTFFVYGVTVADTPVTVTASHQGLTASAVITVRSKPALSSITLSAGSVKGGIGTTGTATINKPAIGPMLLTLSSSNTSLAQVSPTSTAVLNGASAKSFYVKTFAVTTPRQVTIIGTFYGSTKTATLTLMP